jgi:hypothetical protein
VTTIYIILAGNGAYDSYSRVPVLAFPELSAAQRVFEALDRIARGHKYVQWSFPQALPESAPERQATRAFWQAQIDALGLGLPGVGLLVSDDFELVECPMVSP